MCARLRKLNKDYGVTITKAQVEELYNRQHGRCAGCQKAVQLIGKRGSPSTACVDHDHVTGVIRGLLCRACNLALGNLYDNRQTMRRLMAYMDMDHSKVNLYLIGSLRNPTVPQVANKLREHGYDVFDEWHAAGPAADDEWQKYCTNRGFTYKDALAGRTAQNTFTFDRAYLDLADAAVMVLPAGKSAHLELGYVRGSGKPAFILLNGEVDRYEVMPNVASAVCYDMGELLFQLQDTFTEHQGTEPSAFG